MLRHSSMQTSTLMIWVRLAVMPVEKARPSKRDTAVKRVRKISEGDESLSFFGAAKKRIPHPCPSRHYIWCRLEL